VYYSLSEFPVPLNFIAKMSDDQSGGDFDGCECYFSHEFAMRRLLSLVSLLEKLLFNGAGGGGCKGIPFKFRVN
jgi:hypothetical protein